MYSIIIEPVPAESLIDRSEEDCRLYSCITTILPSGFVAVTSCPATSPASAGNTATLAPAVI